jgi:hypothetical protein
MSDFKAALNEGFAAADKAELARREIDEVLRNFNQDLMEATGGKLSAKVKHFERVVSDEVWPQLRTLAALQGRLRKEYFSAIVATNPTIEKSPEKELARWRRSHNGYPCTITWSNEEHQCSDRVSLEGCLADLLRDAGVAEVLKGLVRLEPPAPAPATAPPEEPKKVS